MVAHQRSPPYVDFQAGSGATDASGDASVSFARAFSGVPKVFLQGDDASTRGIVIDKYNVTAAGFAVKARKVTGLPTGSALWNLHYGVKYHTHGGTTDSGGVDHSHGFSGDTGAAVGSTTAGGQIFVTGADPHSHGPGTLGGTTGAGSIHSHTSGTYYAASHSHGSPITSGYPSSSATVASSTHTHSGTTGAHNSATKWGGVITAYDTKYAHDTSDPASALEGFSAVSILFVDSFLYGAHTHDFTTGSPGGLYPTTSVASSVHTHTVTLTAQAPDVIGTSGSEASHTHGFTVTSGSTSSEYVSLYGLYHYHGYSGGTGGASAYSHTHGFTTGGATLTDTVTGGALVSTISALPEDYISVIVGDSPVVGPVSFDWLAILA